MSTTYTPEQQREHRKLWVEALRSGKYQQATGALRAATGFCCLGVACDISGLGEWNPSDMDEYITPYYRHAGSLEDDVREWLGLRGPEGELDGDDETSATVSLASKNDQWDTFAQIADIIESEPEGLIATPTESAS